jgi:hypothetical protein
LTILDSFRNGSEGKISLSRTEKQGSGYLERILLKNSMLKHKEGIRFRSNRPPFAELFDQRFEPEVCF